MASEGPVAGAGTATGDGAVASEKGDGSDENVLAFCSVRSPSLRENGRSVGDLRVTMPLSERASSRGECTFMRSVSSEQICL